MQHAQSTSKARVITFTFNVKRIINTLFIYLIFSSEKRLKSSGCLKTGSGVTARGILLSSLEREAISTAKAHY